jgi:hypothetical protein
MAVRSSEALENKSKNAQEDRHPIVIIIVTRHHPSNPTAR